MKKYLEVAQYFCQQHPLLVVIMALGMVAIALMWYAAKRNDLLDGYEYEEE